MGDEGVKALAPLTSLQSLYLSNNRVGDEGVEGARGFHQGRGIGGSSAGPAPSPLQPPLAPLTSLQSLYLSNNSVGAEGVKALAPLTSLQSLYLSNNSVGAEGVKARCCY